MRKLILCGALLLVPPASHAGALGLWKRGVESYSTTGHMPDTPAWNALEARHDLDPERFDAHHPTLAGLFTPTSCVGKLPDTPFWGDKENRYLTNPARFATHHPLFLAEIVARSIVAKSICHSVGGGFCPPFPPCVPPPPPPIVASEPSGAMMGIIGLMLASLVMRIRRRV